MKKRTLTLIDFFLIFIILLFSFAIFGLQPLSGNNVIYVPFMEYLQDSSLFPQDLLLKTVKFHPTLFFRFMVSLTNLFHFSIKQLFSFLPWPIFYLQGLMIFSLSQLLFNNKKISYLALIFLLSPKFSLAYESVGINLHQITPTNFVMPLGLLAIYFYLAKKEKLSFLLLGIISNFQPITSVQLVFLFTFSQFIMSVSKKQKLKLIIKKLFLEYVFLSLGSLPILLVLTRGSKNFLEWLATPKLWLEIVEMRTGHHFFPSTWQFRNWLIFAFFLILFYLSINFKKNNSKLNIKDKKVISFVLAFIPIFVLVEFFSEVVPLRAVMLLSLFRSFIFFNLFCFLYFAFYCLNLLKSANTSKNLIGLFFLSLFFLPTSAFYSSNFFKPSILGVIFLFVIASLIILITAKMKIRKNRINKTVLIIIVLFLCLASIQRMYRNYKNWYKITFDNSKQKDWHNVQVWANKNTPKNSVFFTPPQKTGFRVFSQRTVVGEYKDGANFIYHPFLLTTWWQRMQDLGVKKQMAKGAFIFGYKEIKNELLIKELGKKYKADFLVSSFDDLKLDRVYNNEKFTVYKLILK